MSVCVHRMVVVTVMISLFGTISIFVSSVHRMGLLTVMMSLLSFLFQVEAMETANGLQSFQ